MKNSNTEKFLEILNELDDDILIEALLTDDKKKLRKATSKNKILKFHPVFIKVAILFLCVAIVASAVFLERFNKNNISVSAGKEILSSSNFSSVSSDTSSRQETDSTSKPTLSSKEENTEDALPENNKGSKISSENASSYVESDTYDPYEWEYIPDNDDKEDHGDYYIDSIDKLNFYAVKKTIEDYSVLPISGDNSKSAAPTVLNKAPAPIKLLSNSIYYYEIDRDTVFDITMETYFTITINSENGFLANKLGGTGLVEVVITENNLDDMITFKKGENYYSCLWSSGPNSAGPAKRSIKFSTHKYIKGYNVVKNFEQHNFEFKVQYENSRVVGFEVIDLLDNSSSEGASIAYEADDVTLMEDYCVVMFIKRSFTIDQLEGYFNNN